MPGLAASSTPSIGWSSWISQIAALGAELAQRA